VHVTSSAPSGDKDLFKDVPGPAPWYVRPGSPTVEGFEWQQTSALFPRRGKTLLVGSSGVVAVIDFYVCVKVIDRSTLLAWYQPRRQRKEESKPVCVTVFQPRLMKPFDSELSPIEEKMGRAELPLLLSQEPQAKVELTTTRIDEDLTVRFPDELKLLDELLILCHSSAIDHRADMKVDLALLVANPQLNIFRLYPQDWFNSADLDFGYQWVTRVVRNPRTGRVHGEGIRINPFELDDSLCQLNSGMRPSSDWRTE
jgi:hypothetical protein